MLTTVHETEFKKCCKLVWFSVIVGAILFRQKLKIIYFKLKWFINAKYHKLNYDTSKHLLLGNSIQLLQIAVTCSKHKNLLHFTHLYLVFRLFFLLQTAHRPYSLSCSSMTSGPIWKIFLIRNRDNLGTCWISARRLAWSVTN